QAVDGGDQRICEPAQSICSGPHQPERGVDQTCNRLRVTEKPQDQRQDQAPGDDLAQASTKYEYSSKRAARGSSRGRSAVVSCIYAGSCNGVAPPRRWKATASAGGEVEVPELATVSTGVPSQVSTCQSPFTGGGHGTHRPGQVRVVQVRHPHPVPRPPAAGCPRNLGHRFLTTGA